MKYKSLFWSVAFVGACSSGEIADPELATDAGTDPAPVIDASVDAGPPSDVDAGTPTPAGFPLDCAALHVAAVPECPAPASTSGQANFCYRPGFPGVTSVDVYGGFGLATDWTAPLVTLTADASGRFVGHAAVANGAHAYLFRTHGGADSLVPDGQYFLDAANPNYVPAPLHAPGYLAGANAVEHSVSSITVPQGAAPPTHHLKGSLLFQGRPQACFSIQIASGEVRVGTTRTQENYVASYAESGADGTFDFPMAAGLHRVTVTFPFHLAGPTAPYPNALVTPVLGFAGINATIGTTDVDVTPLDVAVDYTTMTPVPNTMASLPATFTFPVLPGAQAALGVNHYTFAGADPLDKYGPYGTATSVTWDGLVQGVRVHTGQQYWWGVWQQHAAKAAGAPAWVQQSLLFPIKFL